jgi:hypothetical protein
VTDAEAQEAFDHVQKGFAIAERIDDAPLMSAALDGMAGITQAIDWPATVELSQRRIALSARIGLQERLDALQVLAWGSAQLGELDQAVAATEAAMAELQPGQNMVFALAAASWNGYCRALQGEWDTGAESIDDLRRRWLDAGRPAAAYALQGLLSGIDWARNRGADQHFDRWSAVANEIIANFRATHPVAAMSALMSLDLDRMADVVRRHERYPDRAHYVEHALALCADRGHAIPTEILDGLLARAGNVGLRVLGAQALRLRGIQNRSAEDLGSALETFNAIGAQRYAARVRVERGALNRDAEELESGLRQMRALGEGDLLQVKVSR